MNAIVRVLFLFLTTFSVFNYFFNWLTKTEIFDYADELLLLFCFVVFVTSALEKRKIPLLYIAIPFFLLYSFLISVAFGLNENVFEIIMQSIVNIKFFIILVAFIILFKNHPLQIERYFNGLIVFVALTLLAHVVLGTKFNTVFEIPTYMRPNVRYTGIFRHPNHLAYLCVLFITLLLNGFKKRNANISLLGWIKIVLAIVAIVLADTRTAMLVIAVLLTAFYWDYIFKDPSVFFGFVSIGVIAIFCVLLFTDLSASIIANIEMSFSLKSNYIRGLMFFMSLLIFVNYFPIGTGAGTFGSIFAKDSQVYRDFGVHKRFYFVEEWGIYDSNVASIVGEYGLLGILLYFLMFKTSYKHLKFNLNGDNKSPMLKTFMFVFV
ncbi:MAG: O-antigen ligase family protein, partial [Bacteroidetes bacterium]|nr:O-antigen ligase family protein [Bacteroidota bacterium]